MDKHILKLNTDDSELEQITLVKNGKSFCIINNITGGVSILDSVTERVLSKYVQEHVVSSDDGIKFTKVKDSPNPLDEVFIEYYFSKTKTLNQGYNYPDSLDMAYSNYLLAKEYKRQQKREIPNSELESTAFKVK